MPSRLEVDDALWAELEPLIPPRERRFRHPGRKAVPGRLVLNGILHVLYPGSLGVICPRSTAAAPE